MAGCSVALVYTKGHLLFQLRDGKTNINPHKWGLIGGMIEEGETSKEALEREMKEEICCVPGNVKYFTSKYRDEYQTWAHYFLVLPDERELALFGKGDEGRSIGWLKLEELSELENIVPEATEFLSERGSDMLKAIKEFQKEIGEPVEEEKRELIRESKMV